MLKLLATTAMCVCAATVLQAQSHGYVFFGPGAISAGGTASRAFMGFGGEGVFRNGLGVGGEIGYTTPWQHFTAGIGVASLNGVYHFARTNRIDPFVTGGYTLFFRSGHVNAFNVGGGVNYWFANHFGAKVEFRNHIDPNDHINVHVWSFRFGLNFR